MSTLKVNKVTARDGSVYGTILQVKTQIYNNQFNVTDPGGSYIQTPLSITIKPLSDNSKFLAVADLQGYCSTGAGNGWNVGIWGRYGMTGVTNAVTNVPGADDSAQYAFTMNAGTSQGDTWMGWAHGSGLAACGWSRNRSVLFEGSGLTKGTPFTMTVVIGGWTSTGSCSMGWGSAGSYPTGNKITVFEIAT